MRDKITFGDGFRFGLGFLFAWLTFVIILFFVLMFLGIGLSDYSSRLSTTAHEFGNGVILWLLN